jgi:uncharacterized membrane protein
VTAPVFWPTLLGLSFLFIGIITYRRDLLASTSRGPFNFVALGPVLVASSLAAFAGEHLTMAADVARMVPKWLPLRVFIAYLVGFALLAAALSLVARRCIRWSAIFLAVMFVLFVLLLHLPHIGEQPAARIHWIVAVRDSTFAMGALALFGTTMRGRWPQRSNILTGVVRVWMACVMIFFGMQNMLHPECSPGVPDTTLTAEWVPLPLLMAYVTGILLIASGCLMFLRKYASAAAALIGLLMAVLTLVIYAPNFFLAHSVLEHVIAINFVADTLLFAGMTFVISKAIWDCELDH